MIIESTDGKRSINIGKYEIWNSVYSTILIRLKDYNNEFPLAIKFLKTAFCATSDAMVTAKQINVIRDRLSQVSPQNAVYDYRNLSLRAPWEGKLSPVITSCANLYTTAEGEDLLFELVSILCYADIAHADVRAI